MKKEKKTVEELSEVRRQAARARWGSEARQKIVSIRCDADAAELVKIEAVKRKVRASAIVAEAIRAHLNSES